MSNELAKLRNFVQGALALYRADLQLIELLRQTIKVDDAAASLELDEALAQLPLSSEQNYAYMPMMPPVMLLNREVAIRLKIEEPGDSKAFEASIVELGKLGSSVDPYGNKIDAGQKIQEGCGALLWTVRTSFGIWKKSGLLEKIIALDPMCADLKEEVTESGASTGRVWFREGVVLRCDIIRAEPS